MGLLELGPRAARPCLQLLPRLALELGMPAGLPPGAAVLALPVLATLALAVLELAPLAPGIRSGVFVSTRRVAKRCSTKPEFSHAAREAVFISTSRRPQLESLNDQA